MKKRIKGRTIYSVAYMVADIWVTFREELDMCGIREDKQSSFRPGEPETSERASSGRLNGNQSTADIHRLKTLSPLEDFSITRALEAVFLSAAAVLRQRNPPNERWALTRAVANNRDD